MSLVRALVVPVLLFSAAASSLSAQQTKQSVLAAEKAWSSAAVAADKGTLDQVLAADLSYNHSTGNTDTKDTYLKRIASGAQKYTAIDYDAQPDVRLYGNTAVVIASAHFKSVTDGKESAPHLHFLHVFVNRDGRWQLVAHQSAVLPH